jgi:hypothetical protein
VLGGIRLGRPDDVVLDRLACIDVAEADLRPDGHDAGRDLLLVHHTGTRQTLLQRRDAVLEHRLLVLRIVVLGVLGDVAEFARLLDALGNLAPLHGREVLDLFLELVVPFGRENDFLHWFLQSP